MATLRARKEAAPKLGDPYLYFRIIGRWRKPILGVSPARPTLPDHLAKLLQDEEERLVRKARKQPLTAVTPAREISPLQNGENATEQEGEQGIGSQRRTWLEEALKDEHLDANARDVIKEVLKELSPAEKVVRALMRATNTFPRSRKTGNFIIPATWFYGALKAALRHDFNVYREQAQEVAKGCIIINPDELDLNTKEPDDVVEANIPLPSWRPGEAQATIKRFHLVEPVNHGKGEFTLVVSVMNSPYVMGVFRIDPSKGDAIQQLHQAMQRTFTVIGNGGLGASRLIYGKFDLHECAYLKPEEAYTLITQLTL